MPLISRLSTKRAVNRVSIKVLAAVLGLLGLLMGSPSRAQSPEMHYPNGPVRLVVPYPPGGVNDAVARVVATKLAEVLGKPVVVDNKPGGGTIIGTQFVVGAQPDGLTLLMINPTSAINVSTQKALPYDVLRDLAPISLIATYPTMMVASPTLPVHNLKEFIALAKAQPGKFNFASGGYGGSTHLAGELFKRAAGIDIVHVPYKGSASTIQALISGDAAIAFGDPPAYLPLARSGKLLALGVASAHRFPGAPDIPTMAEAGLPGFEIDTWLGIAAPAATLPAVLGVLNRSLATVTADPAVRESLAQQGVQPAHDSSGEFRAILEREVRKWADVVRAADIHPD